MNRSTACDTELHRWYNVCTENLENAPLLLLWLEFQPLAGTLQMVMTRLSFWILLRSKSPCLIVVW